VKTLPDSVKAILYDGAKNHPVILQFHSDLNLYGMWEALLYVESYTPENYKPETATNCFHQMLNELALPADQITREDNGEHVLTN
jgi:hypothetical protein